MFRAVKLLIFGFVVMISAAASSVEALAAEIPIVTKAGELDVNFDENFLILEDPEARLTAAQAMSQRDKFQPIKQGEHHRGYSSSAIWVLFSVENNSADNVISLASTYPVVDLKAFRVIDDRGRIEHAQVYERRIPSVQLNVSSGTKETFLVRVTSSQFLVLKFYLTTIRRLDEQENSSNMLYALIFGCFLTAFMTNFALFLILRYRSYLYYLIFSLVNCHLTFLAIKFPADILQWWGVYWYEYVHPYSTLGAFTTFLFVRNFLQTKDEFPILDALMKMFMFGCLCIAAIELYDYSPTYPNFADMYYQIGVLLLIIAGVKSLRSGFAPSKYYLMSLFCFLGGIATYLTLTFGYLPSNIFTLNSLVIGQTAEMMLMSLALSSKLKLIERESNRSAMKTQLLKTITHDISNPLSIIKISTEYFHTLGQSRSLVQIERATKIIENLIHYVHERRVSENVDIKKVSLVSLNEVFEEVEFSYSLRAETKKIALDFERNSPEIFVWAQKSTLTQQILGNLVSNAIKFSPEGGSITVRAIPVTSSKVVIEVRDRGDGMQAVDVARLNRTAERNVSTPGTCGETGFGYGISIVKDTLRAINGRLEIISVLKEDDPEDYGTTVRIALVQGRIRKFWLKLISGNAFRRSRRLRALSS